MNIDLAQHTTVRQYLPGANEQPWFYPDYPPYMPPRGRWIWVPDLDDGMCDACRRGGGVCGCVRPGRNEITCRTFAYESSVVAHVGQH